MSLTINTLALNTAATAAPAHSANASKIHDAAEQFESLLVGEMLKSAREDSSDGWLGSGSSTGDDTALDMAESQLANALSRSGGLGLAKVIEQTMSAATHQNIADTPQEARFSLSSKNRP